MGAAGSIEGKIGLQHFKLLREEYEVIILSFLLSFSSLLSFSLKLIFI